MIIRVAGLQFAKHNLPLENITLIPEPENKFDKNAIRIEASGKKLGYVPRIFTHKVRIDSTVTVLKTEQTKGFWSFVELELN